MCYIYSLLSKPITDMRILIAPNAFKNSLGAPSCAEAIESGVLRANSRIKTAKIPIADGGDGTLEVLAGFIDAQIRQSEVLNPIGAPIHAKWALKEDLAIIEMAEASGIRLIPKKELNPEITSSDGTGQLIREALDNDVKKNVIGLGGSATVDGGTGILRALGVKFYDKGGKEIITQNPLIHFDRVDWSALYDFGNTKFLTLCDVTNPLTGEEGASHVFGPQKGADKNTVKLLEESMQSWKEILEKTFKIKISELKGGGAAGGISAMLYAVFGAELTEGTEYVFQTVGMEEAIKRADLIITAEGKVDKQTISGKGPAGVATLAHNMKKPVICLAGQISDIEQLNKCFDAVFPISNGPNDLETLLQNTYNDLSRTTEQLIRLFQSGQK